MLSRSETLSPVDILLLLRVRDVTKVPCQQETIPGPPGPGLKSQMERTWVQVAHLFQVDRMHLLPALRALLRLLTESESTLSPPEHLNRKPQSLTHVTFSFQPPHDLKMVWFSVVFYLFIYFGIVCLFVFVASGISDGFSQVVKHLTIFRRCFWFTVPQTRL